MTGGCRDRQVRTVTAPAGEHGGEMRGREKGRGGCLAGTRAYQDRIGVDGKGRGGRTATRWSSEGGGQSGGETGQRRRFRPPFVDSFGAGVQRFEVETTACLTELAEATTDGESVGGEGRLRPMSGENADGTVDLDDP